MSSEDNRQTASHPRGAASGTPKPTGRDPVRCGGTRSRSELVWFPASALPSYFKDELLVTLATCSTEAVLPRMMAKLERLGCEHSVVGLVLPMGYTFNADGTSIYLTMAAVFAAAHTAEVVETRS
jgi:Sodium:dicarboxylate symporter family